MRPQAAQAEYFPDIQSSGEKVITAAAPLDWVRNRGGTLARDEVRAAAALAGGHDVITRDLRSFPRVPRLKASKGKTAC